VSPTGDDRRPQREYTTPNRPRFRRQPRCGRLRVLRALRAFVV